MLKDNCLCISQFYFKTLSFYFFVFMVMVMVTTVVQPAISPMLRLLSLLLIWVGIGCTPGETGWPLAQPHRHPSLGELCFWVNAGNNLSSPSGFNLSLAVFFSACRSPSPFVRSGENSGVRFCFCASSPRYTFPKGCSNWPAGAS